MSRGVCFLRVWCHAPFCCRRTALICAAINNHAEVVKLLLADERVDVNAKENIVGYFWARGAMAWRGHTRTHTRTCTRAHARTRFNDEGARKPGIRFICYFIFCLFLCLVVYFLFLFIYLFITCKQSIVHAIKTARRRTHARTHKDGIQKRDSRVSFMYLFFIYCKQSIVYTVETHTYTRACASVLVHNTRMF